MVHCIKENVLWNKIPPRPKGRGFHFVERGTMKPKVFYVIEYSKDEYYLATTDGTEKGFPYGVWSLEKAKIWTSKKEAEDYIKLYPKYKFILKEITDGK